MSERDAEDEPRKDEWVLILSQWDNDKRGFERPALERFDPDGREKAEDIRHKYADNDALHPSDYTLTRRKNVKQLPYSVSFGDCNDGFVSEGSK